MKKKEGFVKYNMNVNKGEVELIRQLMQYGIPRFLGFDAVNWSAPVGTTGESTVPL